MLALGINDMKANTGFLLNIASCAVCVRTSSSWIYSHPLHGREVLPVLGRARALRRPWVHSDRANRNGPPR